MKKTIKFMIFVLGICGSALPESELVGIQIPPEVFEARTLCAESSLIDRFNAKLEAFGIKEKIPLFNLEKTKAVLPTGVAAFYTCRTVNSGVLGDVTLIQPEFFQASRAIQNFIIDHELRHHLQCTTDEAKRSVAQYQKTLKMTKAEASEYDADTFAIRGIKCPCCVREIMNTRYLLAFFGDYSHYDCRGYLTSCGIKPFLKEAQKNPVFCDDHTPMRRAFALLIDSSIIAAPVLLLAAIFYLETKNSPYLLSKLA